MAVGGKKSGSLVLVVAFTVLREKLLVTEEKLINTLANSKKAMPVFL